MKNTSRANIAWDPVLLASQIVSMQTLHYLTLCILIPPLLSLFAEPSSLMYEGGAASIGMIMDWREMAGRPTVRGIQGENGRWNSYTGAWSGGKQVGYHDVWGQDRWEGRTDPMRGWVIAVCWVAAAGADICYIYHLIRRPRMVLDFALTLVFNHLVLTTYYSASIPVGLFFWFVMIVGAVLTVIVAEQLCVKREMAAGLVVKPLEEYEQVDNMEMGSLLRRD